MRQNILNNNIIHYHGAVESQIEHLKKYKDKEGTFIKKFLIGEEFNMNEWKVTWDAIQKDVWGFIGKPLVLTPEMDHPAVKDQEDYKIGEIIDVGIDELKRTAWQVSQIHDENVAELIREGKIKYGSPTVLTYSQATTQKSQLGNGKEQSTLHRFIPAHDALVADPAYGKMVDKIPAICDGTGEGCGLKLLEVSASVQHTSQVEKIIQREHELIDKGIPELEVHEMLKKEFEGEMNDDNINQLTIVPFVKKSLKKHFKGSTINEIVDYIKTAETSKLESCVSRKIKIISDENPKMKNDQIVAIAYSYCRENKKGEIEDMIGEDLGEDLLSIHEQIRYEMSLQNDVSHKIDNVKTKLKQIRG